jgi:trk system potassium uptake protein TrkH
MNRKMVFYMIGKIVLAEAAMLLLPLVVALLYKETPLPFLITIGIALVLGIALSLIFKPKDRVIYAKEGFVIVAFAWIALSLIGCIPFVLSGALPNFFDAFFETVSGFTTTGASVMTDVESMPHGVLMWRSFTHWVGGMGVLVFIMAIIPSVTDRSIHILRAEMPGPIVGKLVPRAKQTARILYLIYVFLTAVEVILLVCGKMPLFDALVHSFGTAGTGGFGIKADSIGSYSTYCQVVITIFMLVFGVNFNLYYLALLRNFRSLFKSQELWCYLGIFGVADHRQYLQSVPQRGQGIAAIHLSSGVYPDHHRLLYGRLRPVAGSVPFYFIPADVCGRLCRFYCRRTEGLPRNATV